MESWPTNLGHKMVTKFRGLAGIGFGWRVGLEYALRIVAVEEKKN